jgi:hypothetical protein
MIEVQVDSEKRQTEVQRRARRRRLEIEEFWRVAPEWMAITGNSEEELLSRFPSYKGTKGLAITPNS